MAGSGKPEQREPRSRKVHITIDRVGPKIEESGVLGISRTYERLTEDYELEIVTEKDIGQASCGHLGFGFRCSCGFIWCKGCLEKGFAAIPCVSCQRLGCYECSKRTLRSDAAWVHRRCSFGLGWLWSLFRR